MKLLQAMVLAATLATPAMLYAGNIPQYTVKKVSTTDDLTAANRFGDEYPFFTDGTLISTENRSTWAHQTFVFPDGEESVNGYKAQGFPIGFDFRLGGQLHNQFIISPDGLIQLGKDIVEFNGYFMGGPNTFQLGMVPTKGGVKQGTVRYKTVGEEGNRVLLIQFETMIIDEMGVTTNAQRGKFSLQIRLFEKDGKVQFAFFGDQSPWNDNGFFTSIHGWDGKDQIAVGNEGSSIDGRITTMYSKHLDLLDRASYIYWNPNDDDEISFTLTFTPGADEPAPAAAPKDLKIVQEGTDMKVSCKRAEGAAATLIAYSNEPFTDADLPEDGVSYRVNGNDDLFASKIGNATVIYYHNDEEPTAVIPDVEPNQAFYVKAFSVNGYPNYNTKTTAEVDLVTTQLPPSEFFITPGEEQVNIHWKSESPVILAMTEEHPMLFRDNYEGVFGTPEITAVAGDEINGGGKVVYAGSDSEMALPIDQLRPNYPTMFRIWNVENGVLSATATDTYVVPNPTLPYEPSVENWPSGLLPHGWETSNQYLGFVPMTRDFAGDHALKGTCLANETSTEGPQSITLTTPELPFEKDSEAILTFEWALETLREATHVGGDEVGVDLPSGNEAGWFGTASGIDTGLHIGFGPMGLVERKNTISEYNGTMTPWSDAGFADGSSTWQPAEINLGKADGPSVVTFTLATQKASFLYLRNIKVVAKNTGVNAVETENSGLQVAGVAGGVRIAATEAADVKVFNLMGQTVASVSLAEGQSTIVELPAGIYVAGGVKVVVK